MSKNNEKEKVPEEIKVFHVSKKSIEESTLKPTDINEFFMYNCLLGDIPILMYLIQNKEASKEDLLEYNRKFMLLEMIDIEERLENLEMYGLIEIKDNRVYRRW
jgi:hypothetical protein